MINTIFITGSSGGIGISLCKFFLDKSYKVVGIDKKITYLKHKNFKFIQCDLEKIIDNKTYLKVFEKKINFLNYNNSRVNLINCVGYQHTCKIEKLGFNQIFKHFNTNFFGPLKIIFLLKKFIKKKNGYLINISSIHTKMTKEKFSSYAASKSALSSFTKSLAIELGKNITCLSIEPGAIETKMLKAGITKKDYSYLKKNIPTKKICDPLELAKFIYFIIHFEIRYINGSEIDFSGGIKNILKV